MVLCNNPECPEFEIGKDTAELDALYGHTGYDVTCGECGRLCVWPEETPAPPAEPDAE